MVALTWKVLDVINFAEEESCPDSDEALTPQKKRKKRLITKRYCVCGCVIHGWCYADITIVARI